jgi:hypothetical protein
MPLALNAFGLFQLLFHIFDHRFVEGGLLFGEVAEQLFAPPYRAGL